MIQPPTRMKQDVLKSKPFEQKYRLKLLHDIIESKNINDLYTRGKNGYNVTKGCPTSSLQYQISNLKTL